METSVFALVGVLITAAVTLVGLLLKRSVDERTLAIASRTEANRELEQRRLQLEAAVQTVQLLTQGDGSPASTLQASSAVLVLAELGQTALALSLVQEMWPKGQMSASAAVHAIDIALGEKRELQCTAANILLANVERLDVGDHVSEWPSRLNAWDRTLDVECRYAIALALVRWLQARGPSNRDDWRLRLLLDAKGAESDERYEQLALPSSPWPP
jgi:hypothetical protein